MLRKVGFLMLFVLFAAFVTNARADLVDDAEAAYEAANSAAQAVATRGDSVSADRATSETAFLALMADYPNWTWLKQSVVDEVYYQPSLACKIATAEHEELINGLFITYLVPTVSSMAKAWKTAQTAETVQEVEDALNDVIYYGNLASYYAAWIDANLDYEESGILTLYYYLDIISSL